MRKIIIGLESDASPDTHKGLHEIVPREHPEFSLLETYQEVPYSYIDRRFQLLQSSVFPWECLHKRGSTLVVQLNERTVEGLRARLFTKLTDLRKMLNDMKTLPVINSYTHAIRRCTANLLGTDVHIRRGDLFGNTVELLDSVHCMLKMGMKPVEWYLGTLAIYETEV